MGQAFLHGQKGGSGTAIATGILEFTSHQGSITISGLDFTPKEFMVIRYGHTTEYPNASCVVYLASDSRYRVGYTTGRNWTIAMTCTLNSDGFTVEAGPDYIRFGKGSFRWVAIG